MKKKLFKKIMIDDDERVDEWTFPTNYENFSVHLYARFEFEYIKSRMLLFKYHTLLSLTAHCIIIFRLF